MTKGIGREGDKIVTNHGCTTETAVAAQVNEYGMSTATVFVNGKGILVEGMKTVKHTWPVDDACVMHEVPHGATQSKVYSKGSKVGRIQDKFGANEVLIEASPNVFCGG
jgi:hypothetical protein